MGRRNRYADKELDELQKVKYENKRLKKQIASLRKQLQRVDIDRYENLKDLLYKHANEDLEEKIKVQKQKLKKQWECHVCRAGFMKIHTINRRDGLVYYRKCTECDNRTKIKPYNNKVEGIADDE
jgi:DNA-directed RNA polymerase subunit M/transcription elongation factor TFIIS